MTITLIMLKRKQRQDLPWSIFIPKLIEMLFEPLNLPNFKKQNKKIPGRETCSKAPRGNSGNSPIRKIKNAGNATGKTTRFKNTKKKKKTGLKRGWGPGIVV